MGHVMEVQHFNVCCVMTTVVKENSMSCFLLLFFGLVWFGFVLFCFVLLILCLSRGGEKESKLAGGEGED